MYARDPRLCGCGAPLLPVHDCDDIRDYPDSPLADRPAVEKTLRAHRQGGTWQSTHPPRHYRTDSGMQPWDVIDAFELDYYRGSALKYLLRAGRKGPALEDLQKAQDFIAKAIEKEQSDG